MKIFLASLLTISTVFCVNGQEIVDVIYLQTTTRASIAADFGAPAKADVDQYRMLYTTTDVDGSLDTVSGLLAVPKLENTIMPTVVYCHGTVDDNLDVPGFLSFEAQLAVIFSSLGTVTLAPDYLGLGVSEGLHPYVHAQSEASASYDMIVAARQYLQDNDLGVGLNEQVFLTGYSQGGHACMALHQYMQDVKNDPVSISYPMSGPYSISGSMKELLLSDEEYELVSYLVATAASYQLVYGNIFPDNDPANFFKAPYVPIIERYINGESGLFFDTNIDLLAALQANEGGAFPKAMVQDTILAAILADDNHPVNVALRDNDTYNWSPEAPVFMLYCMADDQVHFTNSLVARDSLLANGGQLVIASDVNPTANHTECVTPAVQAVIFNLLTRIQLTVTSLDEELASTINIYPNPATELIFIDKMDDRVEHVEVINAQGSICLQRTIAEENTSLDVSQMPTGIYFVRTLSREGKMLEIKKIMLR